MVRMFFRVQCVPGHSKIQQLTMATLISSLTILPIELGQGLAECMILWLQMAGLECQ